MSKNALKFNNLLTNTNYEAIITLDDGSGEEKQVRRITIKTPPFLPSLKSFFPQSTTAKNLTNDQKTTPTITYPTYTSETTHTFKIVNISVDLGKDDGPRCTTANGVTRAWDPNTNHLKNKCTITITFDSAPNPELAKQNSITNIATPLYDIFTDLSTGVSWNGKKMKIIRNWNTLDPSLTTTDQYIKPTTGDYKKVYGFWDSDVFKVLYDLSKKSKKSDYWRCVKNGYIQYSTSKKHPGHSTGGVTTNTFTLDTTLNTTVPSGIIANTINDYDGGIVDYIYFFVNQKDGDKNINNDKWYYFDNYINTITPASVNGPISGSKGYIQIRGDKIIGTFPKTVGDGNSQISKNDLKTRPISASAKIFSGSQTATENKYDSGKFGTKQFNVKFAVVRYISKDGGKTWTGTPMPNIGKESALYNLSSTEVIGAI